MGTLSSLEIIRDGSLSDNAKVSYRDNVVSTIKQGLTIGNLTLPQITTPIGNFENDQFDRHEEEFPSWHGYYVDGLLTSVAQFIDIIPDTGILRPLFFDPTKPIADLLIRLQSLFERIFRFLPGGFESIEEYLFLRLDVVLSKADDIIRIITNVAETLTESIDAARDAAANFIEVLVDIIRRILPDSIDITQIEQTLISIRNERDQIIDQLIEIAKDFLPDIAIPEISLGFTIPTLDLSFMPPGVNLEPLFMTVEVDGFDGIVTKFAKIMAAFVSFPLDLINQIKEAFVFFDEAAEQIKQLVNAIKKLLFDPINAVKEMLGVIFDIVWNLITTKINLDNFAFIEISSVVQLVINFCKYFIVSLIGLLLGTGLIVLSAAKALEIS